MKRKVFLFLILVFVLPLISPADCTSDWHCTSWSECINGDKIRSCVDFNLCGTNAGKPDEIQTCPSCVPNWDCSDWQPSECPEGGLQTKSCTDLNNCGTSKNKPVDSRSCTYNASFSLGFVILVAILIFMIVVDILLIVRQWEKLNQPEIGPPPKKFTPGLPPTTITQPIKPLPSTSQMGQQQPQPISKLLQDSKESLLKVH